MLPYKWKIFEGENFTNFKVLWLIANVFSTKFGGVASFGDTSKTCVCQWGSFISLPASSPSRQILEATGVAEQKGSNLQDLCLIWGGYLATCCRTEKWEATNLEAGQGPGTRITVHHDYCKLHTTNLANVYSNIFFRQVQLWHFMGTKLVAGFP